MKNLYLGIAHRSKYFKNITSDLKDIPNKSTHTYLENFHSEIEKCPQLNIDKILNLISHINNFELKPLRAFFNDEKHANGDKWDTQNDLDKLSRIFEKWILKQWRVSDSDGGEKKGKYTELKGLWKEHEDKNDVISFWVKTDPDLTIPPYQDIKNRRPPKCQTLILNS